MRRKRKMATYLELHSKEYFMKTREKFIKELKEGGGLSEDDLKMIEEVWGRQRII